MFRIRVSVLALALALAWHLASGAWISPDVESHLRDLEASLAQADEAAESGLVDIRARPGPLMMGHHRPHVSKAKREEIRRRQYLQDCVFEEQFGEWSSCSATCGGGLRTRSVKRKIIIPQDKEGYGKACPTYTRSFGPCNHEILCSTDCSTVDLNNRLSGVGGATKWEYETESGRCVFQLWQVVPGDSSSSSTPRVRLLGETELQWPGADAAVYDAASPKAQLFAIQADNADLAAKDVAVGFRNCVVRSKGDVAPSVAKVCLWGGEGFALARQVLKLDLEQLEALARFRLQSKTALGGQLVKLAATKEGLGAGSPGVSFEGAGTGPGFAVHPTLAPQPPSAPNVTAFAQEGDDVKLKLAGPPRDNGAVLLPGFKVLARRLFGREIFGTQGVSPREACQFVDLPDCSRSPQQPCLDAGLILRNLPLASNYQLQIVAKNAAGEGQPGTAVVVTRGKAGLPLQECWVDYWSCDVDWFSKGVYPDAGDPECSLSAPPLPTCRILGRQDKCEGKKYFVKCIPVMKEGVPPTCAGEKEKVCVNHVENTKGEPPNPKCEAKGCSKSFFFWNQKTCCCQSATDTAEDSPSCACSTGKCKDLGLFDAKHPERSCRH